MIATITRQQIGTVERALQIFLKLGLVEVLDSGTFYMSNIELLIGQSSTEAERKRAARLQNKALSAPRTNGGHLSDTRPPEIELEKEIEIKRDREGTPRPRLWPLPECFLDGRGTGRFAGQLSHRMEPVHRKAVRVHGFYRQAVSEPCRHHPALGQRGRQESGSALSQPGLQRKGG